jgi:hypothetical protein
MNNADPSLTKDAKTQRSGWSSHCKRFESSHDQDAYVLFVDLVKAYDTVNREMLWLILARLGIPPQMIQVLQKLYTDVTIHMKIGSKTESFGSTCGVKQGDNLGPILFIFVIQAVSITLDKKWNFQKPNFRWRPFSIIGRPQGSLTGMNYRNKGQSCSQWKSYYVDDAAFLLLNRSDATEASKLIVSHFRRFGLTVHAGVRNTEESSKTEAMYFPAPLKEPAADAIADIELDNNGYFSFTKEFKKPWQHFVHPRAQRHNRRRKANWPSEQSVLRDEPECPQEKRDTNLSTNADIPSHHRKPCPMGLWKLGTERKRQAQARSLPPPMPPPNAELDDPPSQRKKNHEPSCAEKSRKKLHNAPAVGATKMQMASKTQ